MKKAKATVRNAVEGLRSSAKRYPKELIGSIREAVGGRHDELNGTVTDELGRVPDHELAAVWLGHATALLRVGGTTVLVDPVFSPRIGPRVRGATIGLSRLTPVPVAPSLLPVADVLILTHAHFDHLDRPTLERLANSVTTVITAERTAELVPPGFARVIELPWDQTTRVAGLSLRAIRPEHWGARTAWDRRRGYNSYLIESLGARRRRVLLAGDTALTRAFDHLAGVDMAVMGIGGYQPWLHAHANPEQVWAMFRAMRGDHLLPVHHSTFKLSEEPAGEPLERLEAAADLDRVIRVPQGRVWSS